LLLATPTEAPGIIDDNTEPYGEFIAPNSKWQERLTRFAHLLEPHPQTAFIGNQLCFSDGHRGECAPGTTAARCLLAAAK
jgi:hypothetical protein